MNTRYTTTYNNELLRNTELQIDEIDGTPIYYIFFRNICVDILSKHQFERRLGIEKPDITLKLNLYAKHYNP